MEQIQTAASDAPEVVTPAQPAAAGESPASSPAPAPSATRPRIPTFEEAFYAPAAAVKDAAADTTPAPEPTPKAEPTPDPQPAATDGPAAEPSAEPVKSDDAPTSDPPRRQSARERNEQEKAELRDEVNRVIAERDALKAQDDQRTQAEQTQRAAYVESVGDDAEYERLSALSNLGQLTDGDQIRTLERWTYNRLHSKPIREHYQAQAEKALEERVTLAARNLDAQDRAFRQGIADRAARLASLPGVDPKIVTGSDDFEVIGRHLNAGGAASRDAEVNELKAQNLRHEARIKELETASVARHPIPAGGRSGNGVAASSFDARRSAADNGRAAGLW